MFNQVYFIPYPTSIYISIQEEENETVRQKKERIASIVKVDPFHIHLFFNFFANELDNSATKRNYSQIRTVPNSPTDIIFLVISKSALESSQEIQNKISANRISLLIRIVPYVTFVIEAENHLTMNKLKEIIEEKTEIPKKSQILSLRRIEGKTYFNRSDENKSLSELGISSGDEIECIDDDYFETNEMKLKIDCSSIKNQIQLPNPIIEIGVFKNETGEFIRERIMQKINEEKQNEDFFIGNNFYFSIKLRMGMKNVKEKDSLESVGCKDGDKLILALTNESEAGNDKTDKLSEKCVLIFEIPTGETLRFSPFLRIPLKEQSEFVSYFTKMGDCHISKQAFLYGLKEIDLVKSIEENGINHFPSSIVVKKKTS